jgi:hypothetical protein
MDEQILKPRRNKIEIRGDISYRESTHCWSLLNLRKGIIEQFPQLKERASPLGYKMILFQEYPDFFKEVEKIRKNKEVIPILMWLIKKKEKETKSFTI